MKILCPGFGDVVKTHIKSIGEELPSEFQVIIRVDVSEVLDVQTVIFCNCLLYWWILCLQPYNITDKYAIEVEGIGS